MSCSPFDLRDYLLGELAADERRQVDLHMRSCNGCHEDLERLRITHSTLLALRDEEVPQRIGFVSDKVFEPSPARRAWQAFWGSSPKLGFASAAMLSAALVVFAFFRPAPAAPVAVSALPTDTAKITAQFSGRMTAAVEKAVAESETRQARKTAELLAAAEQRFEQRRQMDMLRVAEGLSVLQKHDNVSKNMLVRWEPGEVK
jgi:anti-sigma factor RsiW